MDVFEGGDEGAIVVLAVLVGEGLACADFFEEVIHPGDGDVRVVFLDLFAVAIELFAEVADAYSTCFKPPQFQSESVPNVSHRKCILMR